jgi:hypothetical protein
MTTPLPNAPNMRIYCAYGHGLQTERAYVYKHEQPQYQADQCPAGNVDTEVNAGQVRATSLPRILPVCVSFFVYGLIVERTWQNWKILLYCLFERCDSVVRITLNCLSSSILMRLQIAAGLYWRIDQSEDNESVDHGVHFADGDGTVPLISLGYLCAGPWQGQKLNPGGVKVSLSSTPHTGQFHNYSRK